MKDSDQSPLAQGLGFWVQGLGFRVQGLGFRGSDHQDFIWGVPRSQISGTEAPYYRLAPYLGEFSRHMGGGGQNCVPFLGPHYSTAPDILGTQKRTIISTTTDIASFALFALEYFGLIGIPLDDYAPCYGLKSTSNACFGAEKLPSWRSRDED